jgi:hypothetical protein
MAQPILPVALSCGPAGSDSPGRRRPDRPCRVHQQFRAIYQGLLMLNIKKALEPNNILERNALLASPLI